MYTIAIIGGGVAGASVAYQLYSNPDFKGKVILLESGKIGKGLDREYQLQNEVLVNSLGDEEKYKPWNSGSNVFENPNRIKMIVTCFASKSKEFYRHHGMIGMKLYNKLASFGRDEQIKIAGEMWGSKIPSSEYNSISDEIGCIQLGSLMVCHKNQINQFKEEFQLLKTAGFECEWWDKEKVDQMHGKTADFYAGIYFPKDSIIDSVTYSQKLIQSCQKKGLEVRDNTRVIDARDITTKDSYQKINDKIDPPYSYRLVEIILENDEKIYAQKVVMATGGLYLDKNIAGILRPCYSYISATKLKINYSSDSDNSLNKIKNSPNFFTFGFTHDWSVSQGYLRVSGEDHFSALKFPRMSLRAKNLENWGLNKYPFFKSNSNLIESQYINGVYSETPDYIPIVGSVNDNSNIFYIMGCNAWGQAILSGAASFFPALLGYRKLTKEEEELVKFVSIRRFRISSPKF